MGSAQAVSRILLVAVCAISMCARSCNDLSSACVVRSLPVTLRIWTSACAYSLSSGTPSARADRQEPLPMFRCPGLPGFP